MHVIHVKAPAPVMDKEINFVLAFRKTYLYPIYATMLMGIMKGFLRNSK